MTELEYEKSCRGNQNPAANEFAWGNTSATALSGLSNANNMSETASNTSANIAYNLLKTAAGGNIAIGPVLLGAAKPVQILTASTTVRRIVNMTAITVADINSTK
jgi:malate dehydrogenase (oxaloacetate-decarboxylating)(NADP+)